MYDVAIILGHANNPETGLSKRQTKRLDKAIQLFNSGEVLYLLPTGGIGFFNQTETPLGVLEGKYLELCGIPQEKILLETTSKNTVENAQNALFIVQEHNLKSAVVVTSFDHMLRSKLIFKKLYPQSISLSFVISDYWTGTESIWDLFWHLGAWAKYIIVGTRTS